MTFKNQLLFIFLLCVASCGGDPEVETDSEYYTQISLDGKIYTHGYVEGQSTAFNNANTFRLNKCYLAHDSAILDADHNGIIAVTFENIKEGLEYPELLVDFTSDFDSFFTEGERNYYSYSDQTILNTVSIEYIDANGTSWRSLENDQPSESKFEITSVEDLPSGGTGLKEKKVSGKFNCIIYDENNNQKTIANGSFVHYIDDNP